MADFEYLVVPAPLRPTKAKGVKGIDNRFAHALSAVMNEHGAMGWEYLRSEMLPCEQKRGFWRSPEIVTQAMLVFRRSLDRVRPAPQTQPRHHPAAAQEFVPTPEELAMDLPPRRATLAPVDPGGSTPPKRRMPAVGATPGPRLGAATKGAARVPHLGGAVGETPSVHPFPGADRT